MSWPSPARPVTATGSSRPTRAWAGSTTPPASATTPLHHQHTALQLAVELDQPADQARVHDGLAHTHHALGDPDQARRHWQAALDLLTGIGTDHTEEPGVTTAAIRTHVHDIDSTNRPSGENG